MAHLHAGLNGTNSPSSYRAMSRASVVFPLPGGPQSRIDPVSPRSIASRSGFPSASRCACPTTSARVRGRRRAASGAPLGRSNSPGASLSPLRDRRDPPEPTTAQCPSAERRASARPQPRKKTALCVHPAFPWNSGMRLDAPTYSVTPAERASPQCARGSGGNAVGVTRQRRGSRRRRGRSRRWSPGTSR